MKTPPDAGPVVSLIVVNHDGAGCIRRCVESLLAETEPTREVLVVDNASSDGSLDEIAELEREYASLRVIRNPVNRGYAGGVNSALPWCRGRLVGILNMDLEAEPGWLGPLVDFLDSHPEVGAVNPLVVLPDGDRVNAIGQDIHVTGLGFNRGLGCRRESVGLQPVAVSGIQGAAFVLRRELLERVGGMDEAGFLYHEDVNLSWLIRLMGLDLYCVPQSVVRHDYFLSMHPQKLFLLERNRWSLLLAYLSPFSLVLLAPALVLTEGMLWAYALLRGPAFLLAKARSYAWPWRTRKVLAARRRFAASLRRRSDRELLRHMKWRYAWGQFAVLASERGSGRRR